MDRAPTACLGLHALDPGKVRSAVLQDLELDWAADTDVLAADSVRRQFILADDVAVADSEPQAPADELA